MTSTIPLGFEVGTGAPISVPLGHTVVCGQTQLSGKTSTLEAMVDRSKLRAVAFVTKRFEGAFSVGRRIAPYFRERTDWRFVASLLEATMSERMRKERPWIVKVTKNTRSLAEVHDNVQAALKKAKNYAADMYTMLDEYLKIAVEDLGYTQFADRVELAEGLNVMDLSGLRLQTQSLVIASVLEWMYEHGRDTVTIIPEAWEFLPLQRQSPVLLAAEQLIRKGAAGGNFVWLDSQDLAGVAAAVRKMVAVYLIGVQREENEVRRMLAHISGAKKPSRDDIMALELGHFYACWRGHAHHVYVQPKWLDPRDAQAVAMGKATPKPIKHKPKPEEPMDEKQIAKAVADGVASALKTLLPPTPAAAPSTPAAPPKREPVQRIEHRIENTNGDVNFEALYQKIKSRLLTELPTNGAPIMVTPPEKLRKDFQQEESARIVESATQLKELSKRILKLVEGLGGSKSQRELAKRLGRSLGGGPMADMSRAVKELTSFGFVKNDQKNGVSKSLRDTIATNLSSYQPTEDEVEAVYQNVLYLVATETDS